MGTYRKILLAVDLTADTPQIAQRAKALAKTEGAEIELLHVIEPVPLVTPLDVPEVLSPTVIEVQNQIAAGARERLDKLAADLGVAASRVQVVIGNTQAEIVRAARERNADLIVLGGRERHGLSLLVDFTEDAVLHKAPCDVLAVRVKPSA
jgi:universal stress protein A